MGTWLKLTASLLFMALFLCLSVPPCSFAYTSRNYHIAPFSEDTFFEKNFVRGFSTKEDVERVLGKANGNGGALFPAIFNSSPEQSSKPTEYEIWCYQDYIINQWTGGRGTLAVELTLQFVLIFFNDDKFVGYMYWHTNEEGDGYVK